MNKFNLSNRLFDLKRIYEHFRKYEYLDYRYFNIPHSSVVYAQSLIKENLGITISLERLQKIMYWEGMLPAKEYGIPQWYIDKHMTPLHVKKRKAEIKAQRKLAKAI